jgi:hypothetical protein
VTDTLGRIGCVQGWNFLPPVNEVVAVDGGPEIHFNQYPCTPIEMREVIFLAGCCRPDGTCGASTYMHRRPSPI